LVIDIPTGDGENYNLFLQCTPGKKNLVYLLQEIGEELAASRVSQQRIKVLTDGHPSPLVVIPRGKGIKRSLLTEVK
jgi:hypothetical protein